MSSVDNVHANSDIIEDTKELVLSQFTDSDNIQSFVELIAERVKDYEDLAESIHTGFLLANATGQTLDFIGEFINLPRDERTDEQYRNAIVFSAIGASAEVNRDGIETLVQLVTGQLGGYFIQGNYRDVYMYLQESCLDRDTAREFLDRYMPLGTELSLLFESGISFGFEGNDAAAGFGKVTERAAEGTAGFKVPLSEAQSNPSYVLPRAAEFSDDQDRDFRTEFAVDIPTAIRAFQWQIPDGYNIGDNVEVNVYESSGGNDAPRRFSKTFRVEGVESSIKQELAGKIARVFLENGIAQNEEVLVDNPASGGIVVSVGYSPATDTSRFVSRNSQAVEVDTQNNMVLRNVDEPRYTYTTNEQGSEEISGLLYELPSRNEIIGSSDFSGTSGSKYIRSNYTTAFFDQSPSRQIRWNDDGSKFYLIKNLDDIVVEFISEGNYSFDYTSSQSFDLSSQIDSPNGFDIVDSGSKMFVYNFSDSTMYRYDFGTAFDLSTLSYSGVSASVPNSLGSNGVRFNNDGLKLYMSNASDDVVRQWSMSSAYDITTLVEEKQFDHTNEVGAVWDIAFDFNGGTMYLAGSIPAGVFVYNLSGLYEVDSAIFSEQLSSDHDVYGVDVTDVGDLDYSGNVAFTFLDGGDSTWKASYFLNSTESWKTNGDISGATTETFFLPSEDFLVAGPGFPTGLRFYQYVTPALPSTLYTFSVFINITGDTRVGFIGVDQNYMNFDCTEGSVIGFSDDNYFDGYNVKPFGDVYRVSVTKRFTGVPTIELDIGTSAPGSGNSVTMKVGGAQFEPFSRATSYMPTDGSIFVRAQDYIATPSGSLISGFANDIDLQVNAKDTTGASVWSYSNLIALTKGEAQVDQGTPFTASQSLPVNIQESQAVENFYPGFGTAYQEPEDESTAEWGRLCTRESLTSRDFLSLAPVQPEDFEYLLDSRFSDTQSFTTDFSRPLQRSEDNLAWTIPEWDTSLSGQSNPLSTGYIVRTPGGVASYDAFVERFGEITLNTKAFEGFSEQFNGDGFEGNLGDIAIPNNPFYFEMSVEQAPITSVLNQNHLALRTAYLNDSQENPVSYLSYINVGFEYNLNTSEMEAKIFSAFDYTDGQNSDSEGQVIADHVLDSYASVGNASVSVIGVLVDPDQGIVRVYTDGSPYDGDTGLVSITDSTANYTNGNAIPVFDRITNRMMLYGIGTTDNSEPEPSSLDDYGQIRFVYEPTELQHTDGLPPNTVDIFGRNIDLLRDSNGIT